MDDLIATNAYCSKQGSVLTGKFIYFGFWPGGTSDFRWQSRRVRRRYSTWWRFCATSFPRGWGGHRYQPCWRTMTTFYECVSPCDASNTSRGNTTASNGSSISAPSGNPLSKTSRCTTRAPFSRRGRTSSRAAASASTLTYLYTKTS